MSINIKKEQLEAGEFYNEVTTKKVIVLHHTAGGPDAFNVINGSWEHDKSSTGGKLPVATSFVIGGPMKSKPEMDGQIWQAFDDTLWAHHLGTHEANNTLLNKQSIGIEICNFGPLTLNKEGKFVNYVGGEIAKEDTYTLAKPFRGFVHYHEYSDKQVASVKELLLYLADKHKINVKKHWDITSFDLNKEALAGAAGIFGHINYRPDKFDISPSPKLLAMLNAL